MDDGDPAAQFFVTAIKPLRDGNRTMLAARAADGDVQLHLARLQVAGDEEVQKAAALLQELRGLGKGQKVFLDGGVRPREGLQLRDVEGVGKEAHVEDVVAVLGNPVFEAEGAEDQGHAVSDVPKELLEQTLPVLLEDAMVWVERNTRTRIAYREDGHAADVPELPLGAVRELIANALVHRSLSPMSHGKRVDVRLSQDRLVISNPGGLYAITASQLGTPGGRSAPNEFLYAICHHLRGADGARLVEAEGGGIIEVREEMSEQHLAPPEFYDTGVSFTAVLHRPQEDDTAATPLPQVVLTPPSAGSAAGAPAGPRRSSVGGAGLPRHGKRVLALLDEPLTITQVVEGSGLTLNQARYTLRRLAAAGLVEMRGSQGDRGTAYARVT